MYISPVLRHISEKPVYLGHPGGKVAIPLPPDWKDHWQGQDILILLGMRIIHMVRILKDTLEFVLPVDLEMEFSSIAVEHDGYHEDIGFVQIPKLVLGGGRFIYHQPQWIGNSIYYLEYIPYYQGNFLSRISSLYIPTQDRKTLYETDDFLGGLIQYGEETLLFSVLNDKSIMKMNLFGEISPYLEGVGLVTGMFYEKEKDHLFLVDQEKGQILQVDTELRARFSGNIPTNQKGYFLTMDHTDRLFLSAPTQSGLNHIYEYQEGKGALDRHRSYGLITGLTYDQQQKRIYWLENKVHYSSLYFTDDYFKHVQLYLCTDFLIHLDIQERGFLMASPTKVWILMKEDIF